MGRPLWAFGFLAMIVVAGSGPVTAQAQHNPVVVELYTSQGCSSCPPADAVFEELARMDGVLALSLHVDYWDYIGWKDVFARPEFTERQQSYAIAAGERMVYTPQMIVGGVEAVVGTDAVAVMERIAVHAGQKSGVVLDLRREGPSLVISAEAEMPQGMPLQVQVIRYLPRETVAIESGENAGHTLTYVNIVTSWDVVAEWAVEAPLQVSVPLMGTDPTVVIVQEPGPGRIVAAARLD